jgi:hypothetical protein
MVTLLRFHVTFTVRDSISLSEIAGVQNRIADAIQKIMQTGKVQASGVLPDRTLFMVIEADKAEDLWNWFAPLFDVAKPVIKPILPFDALPKLFEELQKL